MPQKGEEEALHFLPIGETGTGKTTLINSFANFARYGNLEEAIENGPVVLSDVGFSYSVAGMRRDPVFVKGSCDNGKELVNHLGMSQTEGCSLYTFESDDSQQLTFYDSPGFGNRNGQQVNLIERPVNAYIIVLKPDETRLNHDLCTFLKKKGKAVSKNIIYCFTNARASNDLQSSTTLIALKSYLTHLEQSLGVEFPTKRENVFCFENDCFRYLCYLSTNPGGGNPSRENVYSNEWKSNVKNFQRLIRHVKTLPAIMHQELDTPFSVPEISKPGPSNLVLLQPQTSHHEIHGSSETQAEEKPSEENKAVVYNVLLFGEAKGGKENFIDGLANFWCFKLRRDAIFSFSGVTGLSRGSNFELPGVDPCSTVRCSRLLQDFKNYTVYEVILQKANEPAQTVRLINVKDMTENIEMKEMKNVLNDVGTLGEIHAVLLFVDSSYPVKKWPVTFCRALPSESFKNQLIFFTYSGEEKISSDLWDCFEVFHTMDGYLQLSTFVSSREKVMTYAIGRPTETTWNVNRKSVQRTLKPLNIKVTTTGQDNELSAPDLVQKQEARKESYSGHFKAETSLNLNNKAPAEHQPTVRFICDNKVLPIPKKLDLLRLLVNSSDNDFYLELLNTEKEEKTVLQNSQTQFEVEVHPKESILVPEEDSQKGQPDNRTEKAVSREESQIDRLQSTLHKMRTEIEILRHTRKFRLKQLYKSSSSPEEWKHYFFVGYKQVQNDWTSSPYREGEGEKEALMLELNDLDRELHPEISAPLAMAIGNVIFKENKLNYDELEPIDALAYTMVKVIQEDLKTGVKTALSYTEIDDLITAVEKRFEEHVRKTRRLLRQ